MFTKFQWCGTDHLRESGRGLVKRGQGRESIQYWMIVRWGDTTMQTWNHSHWKIICGIRM